MCHCRQSLSSACKASSSSSWASVAIESQPTSPDCLLECKLCFYISLRADSNYPAAACSLYELYEGSGQPIDLKPCPPLSFSLNGARLADMNPPGCPHGVGWIQEEMTALSLFTNRGQRGYSFQTLCAGNATISYIEEGLTRHLWPLLTSPSCASAALTLLHPTHTVDWCQQCENIYIWNWKASLIQEPLPALCQCLIVYKNSTFPKVPVVLQSEFCQSLNRCNEIYGILTRPCRYGT